MSECLRRHTIALADDHAVVRAGYRRLLELEPELAVVAEYADAEAAYFGLAQQQDGEVELLVLDLSMPGRGGLEMLRRLRQRRPGLKVLVFTMHESVALMSQCRDAGANGYVTKSSDPVQLVAAVRAALAGESVWPAALAAGLREGSPHERLSPREFDVLQHLLAGRGVEQIAQILHLSPKTVANYQTLVRQKLGIGTAVELLHYAREHGLATS
jgi:DNA-binding NarL/FixJ family response regulator